jgi:hypothetical protein
MFTKKEILLFIAVVIISHSGLSQTKFGIETGLNFSKASVSSMYGDDKTGIRTGSMLGCFFEFYTSKEFSIQPGIRYIQKGNTSNNGIVELTQQVDYLEFPVTCNIVIEIQKFKPFLSAGMYLGYVVHAAQKQKYRTGEFYKYDVSDFYKSSDIGYLAGIGLNYEMTKSVGFFAAVHYAGGWKNVLVDESLASANNTGFQLSAGIKLRL